MLCPDVELLHVAEVDAVALVIGHTRDVARDVDLHHLRAWLCVPLFLDPKILVVVVFYPGAGLVVPQPLVSGVFGGFELRVCRQKTAHYLRHIDGWMHRWMGGCIDGWVDA